MKIALLKFSFDYWLEDCDPVFCSAGEGEVRRWDGSRKEDGGVESLKTKKKKFR